jgi:hypothetical protein
MINDHEFLKKKKWRFGGAHVQKIPGVAMNRPSEKIGRLNPAPNKMPSKISTISKSRRFDKPKDGPGVGDYSIRNKWVKKSFNIKYNNDEI